jgi:ribosomal protein S17
MTVDKTKTMNPVSARVVGGSTDGKTIKVEIPTIVQDGRYGKRLHKVITLLAHNGTGKAVSAGTMVKILPSRRVSKRKSWAVVSAD